MPKLEWASGQRKLLALGKHAVRAVEDIGGDGSRLGHVSFVRLNDEMTMNHDNES